MPPQLAEIPRARLVAWGIAALLVAVLAWRMIAPALSPAPAPAVRIGADPATDPGERSRGAVYVHVAGAVRRPGVYRVPGGARVMEALARAGGPARRADLTAVNLAARLEDAQQIVVPRAGAAAAAAPAAAGAAPAAAGRKLSLATATVEQLDALDGIGPTLAKRIVDHREANGGFRSVDELGEVEGIGDKRLARLRDGVQP